MGHLARITALLVCLAPAAGQAHPDQNGYYGHHMWGGGGWMGWIAGPMMMLLMIAIVVAVVVLVVRWLGTPGHPPPSAADSPLDILKERYARGELDKEEFEERRRVLGD